MDRSQYGCSRRAALGCLLLLVMLFGCVGSAGAVIDVGCYNAMTAKLPIYPDSQVVTWKYNFLRAFGMGETLILLTTPDSVEVVRDWYGHTVGAVYKAVQDGSRSDPFFFIANARYTITAAPDDSSGSQILLSGVCSA